MTDLETTTETTPQKQTKTHMLSPLRSRHARRTTAQRRHRRSSAAGVAATVMMLGALGLASPASAQTTDPSGTTGGATVTGTAAASTPDCTPYYKWYISGGTTFGGYAKAEWTCNPYAYLIQVRVWCGPIIQWRYSGIVKRTYLWDQAGCPWDQPRMGSYIHISYNGGSTWAPWKYIGGR